MIICLSHGLTLKKWHLTRALVSFRHNAILFIGVMLWRILMVMCALSAATDALAALGQAPLLQAPVFSAAAKPRLLASGAVLGAGYTVYELQLETGTVLREFADSSGQVFAVSWRGPVLPDLNLWLGGYYGVFKYETEQQRLMGRRGAPINMAHQDLVVRSNGRMRNFFGHAYLPASVPATVDVNKVLHDVSR